MYDLRVCSLSVNKVFLTCYQSTKCDSLRELKQHMSKTHQLFQCDLCTDNYLLFPAERKWYNRADLARHKRKGDPDDKSHKGHPLCTFCDVRFLDEHELYRHLRRDHHLCHICEADNGEFFFKLPKSLKVPNCPEFNSSPQFTKTPSRKPRIYQVHWRTGSSLQTKAFPLWTSRLPRQPVDLGLSNRVRLESACCR